MIAREEKIEARYSLRSGLVGALLVAVFTALLYLPSLNGTFVYDDQLDILENSAVHELRKIPDYLSLSAMRQGLYDAVRPVYVVSIIIEWALWGAKPFGYHAVNLALHVLNTLLLFLWIRHLLSFKGSEHEKWVAPCAAIGTLLFSLHPAASEAVCAVTFRKDLMVTFFTFIGLTGLIYFPGRSRREAFLLGSGIALAFLLAVGSKETGIVGPYLALLYWVLFRGRTDPRSWGPLLGVVFLTVHAFIVLRLLAPNHAGTVNPQYLGGSFAKMMVLQPKVWDYQIGQILFPGWARFCADPFQLALGMMSRPAGMTLAVAAFAVAVWVSTKDRIILFGLALYALALLPVSNLLPISQVMADRFLYLPLVGMAIAVSAGLFRLLPKLDLQLGVASLAVGLTVFAGLSLQTLDRQRVWHDDLSLWKDTLVKSPTSLNALMGYAGALYVNGDARGAVVAYKQLVERTQGVVPDAWAGLASSLDGIGQTQEADRAFAQLVKMDPRYLEPDRYGQRALHFSEADMADFRRLAKRYKPGN